MKALFNSPCQFLLSATLCAFSLTAFAQGNDMGDMPEEPIDWTNPDSNPGDGGWTTSPLIDGHIYNFVSKNSGRCFDLRDHALDNGTVYQQWDCTGEPHQRFRAVATANAGYWEFVNVQAKKCVTVPAAEQHDGAGIQSWDCKGGSSASQQLYITPNSFPGTFSLRFKHSDKCMDVQGKEKHNGLIVHQWECNSDAPDQAWIIKDVTAESTQVDKPIADGAILTLKSRNSGRCLDLRDGNVNNGTLLQQWDCQWGNPNQHFRFDYVGDGFYQIVNIKANKCISVDNFGQGDGHRIHSWDCYGNTDQRFRLTKNDFNGSYSLRFQHSNKCVDVEGKDKHNGLVVHQWQCVNDAADQAWDLVP